MIKEKYIFVSFEKYWTCLIQLGKNGQVFHQRKICFCLIWRMACQGNFTFLICNFSHEFVYNKSVWRHVQLPDMCINAWHFSFFPSHNLYIHISKSIEVNGMTILCMSILRYLLWTVLWTVLSTTIFFGNQLYVSWLFSWSLVFCWAI